MTEGEQIEFAIRRVVDRLKSKSWWSKTSKDMYAIDLLESILKEIDELRKR